MNKIEKSVYEEVDFGHIALRLDEILKEKGFSRTRLSKVSGIRYDILQRYYDNSIERMDKTILAKICYCLNCTMGELLVYHEGSGE